MLCIILLLSEDTGGEVQVAVRAKPRWSLYAGAIARRALSVPAVGDQTGQRGGGSPLLDSRGCRVGPLQRSNTARTSTKNTTVTMRPMEAKQVGRPRSTFKTV